MRSLIFCTTATTPSAKVTVVVLVAGSTPQLTALLQSTWPLLSRTGLRSSDSLATGALCGAAAGTTVPMLGPALVSLSPVNLAFAAVAPARALGVSLNDPEVLRTSFVFGGLLAAVAYATLTYAMLAAIRRSFMMTVRRLAGLK